jgi:DNA-binding PadR family transcriptional regulator
MTEKLLLGMLLYKSMTIYEIKKGLEQTVGFFSSFSFGSIHPAIKKLAAAGEVTAKTFTQNGRSKTVYTITDSGRASFREWLDTKVTPGRIQDDGLLRVFFLTELPLIRRAGILKDYVESMQMHHDALKTAQSEHIKSEESIPPAYRETYDYRMATIEYGIEFYAFTINWYKKLINKIEKGIIQ